MRKSNFALRLQPSLLEEARRVAETEGVALNQLINVAVAEKLSALRIESYFSERAARGDATKALDVLKRAGRRRTPVPGDELPRPTARPGNARFPAGIAGTGRCWLPRRTGRHRRGRRRGGFPALLARRPAGPR